MTTQTPANAATVQRGVIGVEKFGVSDCQRPIEHIGAVYSRENENVTFKRGERERDRERWPPCVL